MPELDRYGNLDLTAAVQRRIATPIGVTTGKLLRDLARGGRMSEDADRSHGSDPNVERFQRGK